jgi:arsenate reductase (glutaredoxin)
MSADKIIVYHNPRCSKSREAIELLRSEGYSPEIVEYLKTPLNESQLTDLIHKLGISPEQLVRKKEELFKNNFSNKKYTDKEWIRILSENPILIERPVVENSEKAVVARPAEKISEIFR